MGLAFVIQEGESGGRSKLNGGDLEFGLTCFLGMKGEMDTESLIYVSEVDGGSFGCR